MREFVPLETFVRPPPASPPPASPPRVEPVPPPAPAVERESDELHRVLECVRRFRAALADALDFAVEAMLADVAASVVARELELAPADVAAIVRNVRARSAGEEPLLVRVHSGDLAALEGFDCAVAADPTLRRGDVEIDVLAGTIDATLGARLEALLAG